MVFSDSMKPAVVICSLRSGPTEGLEALPPKEGLKSFRESVTSCHSVEDEEEDGEEEEEEELTVSMSC